VSSNSKEILDDAGLEVVHPHAAGIDVGNGAHYVAVRPDRYQEPVRRFECFTADPHRLADWLGSCKGKTVAMQSTGIGGCNGSIEECPAMFADRKPRSLAISLSIRDNAANSYTQ